jgi:hypothetical protein
VADLEADRLRALMRATVFGQPRQPVTIDRYEIVRLLGSGAMGLVYEVFDPKRGEQVALKTLRGQSARALTLFKREFRALSRITHPNLVGLYELGRDEHQFFFTMELVRGVQLLKYLWGADPEGPEGELPLSPVADFSRLRGVFAQLAEGVQALHQAHKLHRDIKPTNVMVTPQGRVVLMDFGFVGEESVGTLESTAGSMVVGTPAFMAPEQALGGPRTPPSDWYAFGATLYMALTGLVPFHGENVATMMERKQAERPSPPRSLAAGIPEDLELLCMQLLQPGPDGRPTGVEVMERLHQGPELSHTRGFAYLSPAATHVGARRFIGRAAEVERLRGAYASVCTDERPVVVLLCSRAGLGKSALIRHVTDELRRSTVVLRARCYERDGVPLKALDSLVDALARYLRQQPRPELAPAVAALAPLFPVLHTGPESQAPARPATHELGPDAFAALRQLLARLTHPRPLVLWIDDLQWGDEGSVRVLQALLAAPDPPPVLLIVSFRSEDRDTSPALRVLQDMSLQTGLSVQAIELGPLGPEETFALASAVLGVDTAPARLAKLAGEAQGSPQFVHDLARFVAHGRGAAPEVTLDELLEIRIARLSAPQRRLLDLIAVAHGPVLAATALRAAEVAQDARAVVQQLLALGLLRSLSAADGEHLDAYHDRTREVVLAHLDGTSLRALHTTLAAALADDHSGDHELLSRLYRGAGDLPRARHHADLAARAAVDARDFDRAAAVLLRTAEWSPADASSLHAQRAAALARAGRSRAAADAYLAARTGADPEVRLQLCADAALHLLTSGHLQAGRKALAEGFAGAGLALPASSVGGRLAALWRRGRMAVRGLHWDERPAHLLPRGALARIDLLRAAAVGALLIDPAGAADIQAQHLLLSLQTGEPRRIGRAIAVEAALAAELDAGGVRAHATLTAARELVDRLGDRETVELVEFVELRDATLRGDFAATLARADALTAANADRALPHARHVVHAHALSALLELGRLPQLAERLPSRLAEALEADDRSALVTLHGLDLWVRLARDDLSGARESLAASERAWPDPAAHGAPEPQRQQSHARAVFHLYAGHPALALKALQVGPGVLHTHPARAPSQALAARVHVAAWRQQPGDAALRRTATRAVDDLQALGEVAVAAMLRASLHPESAEHLLRGAAETFATRGQALHHAVALLRLRDPAGTAALRALGVVDPDRYAGLLAP